MGWGDITLGVGLAVGCALACRSLFHVFQLESYQFPGYFRSLKRNPKRAALPGLCMALASVLPSGASYAVVRRAGHADWLSLPSAVCLVCGILLALSGCLVARLLRDPKPKKPFVVTARIKRLYGAAMLLYALLLLAAARVLPPAGCLAVLMAFPLLLPLRAALAGLCVLPLEKLIQTLYLRDARRILAARPDLIKIGITGSYGKTSVKFILGTILAEKYQTLVSPASFNTPMGLTKVIRTELLPSHQVFVAEMGARHTRDIRDLCRLVHPRYGVLTSVGPQHLDTFHSIDNIRETKYDLMRAVPEDGCCFFPDDGGICLELYRRTGKPRMLCGMEKRGEVDVWAENVSVSSEGCRFRLCTAEGSVDCQTELLGGHSVQNILLASSVALRLGMSLRQIARGIARLRPVEHRMQLIRRPGGVTMIDDAFNSNPRSAEAALNILKDFQPRRIIVTPGMVELGDEEAEFNRRFGRQMAACVDLAVLVGRRRTGPIREGLREAGFPEENIHTAASLNEATALLRTLTRAGDTVLFENDLPDNYNEA